MTVVVVQLVPQETVVSHRTSTLSVAVHVVPEHETVVPFSHEAEHVAAIATLPGRQRPMTHAAMAIRIFISTPFIPSTNLAHITDPLAAEEGDGTHARQCA